MAKDYKGIGKNVCITVPEELLRKLDEFPEINRSKLFRMQYLVE